MDVSRIARLCTWYGVQACSSNILANLDEREWVRDLQLGPNRATAASAETSQRNDSNMAQKRPAAATQTLEFKSHGRAFYIEVETNTHLIGHNASLGDVPIAMIGKRLRVVAENGREEEVVENPFARFIVIQQYGQYVYIDRIIF